MVQYYFCAEINGFYDSDTHGVRMIHVPDPNWVPSDADPDAQAPLVEIDNPDCEIPADAVEISAELRHSLFLAQDQGRAITSDENGYPMAADRAQGSAVELRNQVKTVIDVAAGDARARFVSAGQLVEAEYRLALEQTKAWRAAGNPAAAVPASIQDWASAAGITAEDAAVSIEQTAEAWESVLLTVRQLRLNGKAAIDAASDDADFDAIAQGYIDQLDALQP